MPASFRVLLSCGPVLLSLLSGLLLPRGGFGGGALLGLLGSGSPLPGGSFGRRTLLRLLGSGSLLPGGSFGGGALSGLLGSGSLLSDRSFSGSALLRLLASGSFGRRALLGSVVRRRRWCHPHLRSRRCMGGWRRRGRSSLHRPMKSLWCRAVLLRCCRCRLCLRVDPPDFARLRRPVPQPPANPARHGACRGHHR